MKRASTSTSPPPTPNAKRSRFEDQGVPAESPEDYSPGGFHPVHLDDKFKDGRYQVVRKLGNGSYSTVWLASDSKTSTFVALKILRAKQSSENNTELPICQYLAEKANDDAFATHVVMLNDKFSITGPNGTHYCLVFEPMGPSVASMVEELPCNRPKMANRQVRYPKTMAKAILRQLLSGLAYIHRLQITHGDVQPGNVLFSIPSLNLVSLEQLRQSEDALSQPLRRIDGRTDLWGPKYLALGQSLHRFVSTESPVKVKLSDFGAAFWSEQPPPSVVTPIALRAPELIFRQPFGSGIDIWAFGCLIYELLTGSRLFSAVLLGDDEPDDADDDHILDLIDVLGPLPEHLIAKWPRRDKWFGPDGERIQPTYDRDDHSPMPSCQESPTADRDNGNDDAEDVDEDPLAQDLNDDEPPDYDEEVLEEAPFINKPLEELFEQSKPDDIDEQEAVVITELIRSILKYEPAERPTAEELLSHPWFQESPEVT